MVASATLAATIYAVGMLLKVVFEVVLLVVAFTTVQRYRPAAVYLIAGAALVLLFGTIAGSVTWLLSGAIVRLWGAADAAQRLPLVSSISSLVLTIVHCAGLALLAGGISRLARPDPGKVEGGIPWAADPPGPR